QQHVTNAQQHVTNALQHVTNALQHVTNALQHVTNARQHVTNALQHVTNARQHVTNALQHVTNALQHVTNARQHVTNAQQHVTNARQHVTNALQHVTNALHHGATALNNLNQQIVLRAADQIAHLQGRVEISVVSRHQPMMNTGMSLRAGFGTTRRKHRRPQQFDTWSLIWMKRKKKSKKSFRGLRQKPVTKMLYRVGVVGGVAVVGVVVGVGKKPNQLHQQQKYQGPSDALWTLTTTLARSCSKKIRKILSACLLAA
ncbi:MAG: hypothetical protein DWI22_02710, partial [Planctomycetota bacterium]